SRCRDPRTPITGRFYCWAQRVAARQRLVRQLLGTDPVGERFPSTSTARTTIADMEILLTAGPFRAVVTFLPREEVRDYLEESMSAAALAAYQGNSEAEVLRRLLNHLDQRFRLLYVLGAGEPEDVDAEELSADFIHRYCRGRCT